MLRSRSVLAHLQESCSTIHWLSYCLAVVGPAVVGPAVVGPAIVGPFDVVHLNSPHDRYQPEFFYGVYHVKSTDKFYHPKLNL